MYRLFLFFLFLSSYSYSQEIHFKSLNEELINSFAKNDSLNIEIKSDSLKQYQPYFNYLIKFYPKIKYKKIIVRQKKSRSLFTVKANLKAFISSPEQRIYTLFINTASVTELDSLSFDKLSADDRIGALARQFSFIEMCGNSGFFDLLGLFNQKNSNKKRKALYKDINMKTIENGLGYQLMSYCDDTNELLKTAKFQKKRKSRKLAKRNSLTLMDTDEIKMFVNDYPVYLQNSYK